MSRLSVLQMRSACLCQPDVGLLLTSDSSYSLRLHRAVEMFEGDWLMMFGSRTTLGSAARAPSPNADTVRWELLGMGCGNGIVRCCCVLCLPCGKRLVAGLPCGTAAVDFVFHCEEPKRWPRLSLYHCQTMRLQSRSRFLLVRNENLSPSSVW